MIHRNGVSDMCREKCCKDKKKKKKHRSKAIKVYSLKIKNGNNKVSISVSATPALVLAVFFGIAMIIRAKKDDNSHKTAAPFGNVIFGSGNIEAALNIKE